ncbi:MAG: alpha-amylase/alpha-mannosidase [Planctomycetes bacterium]|nr:alpha-amylase/alpha-mannosidase [Planctomycetota bacterium]MCG2682680.1 glycoside hydrolase family 57 protein [Planctomycetales bacterium]
MHEVALAFLWHQHQPYYPDDISGENPMPWVRLHGTKDYWGMAMLLKEAPELHATINLVPSLLQQLSAYTDRGQEDTHLRVSRLPADGLSEEDSHYLLDNFFMVHPDQMIRPFPRYYELYKKRGLSIDSAEKSRKRFSKRDIIDLQCWSNLAWIHPLAFEQDAALAEFREKGRGWTEKEKQWLLDRQMELLREIVPLHRELMERGQVELTTTPFHHPILPLLWDKRLARRAMPNAALPTHLEGYAEDAREQVRRAVEYHEKLFGQKPRGMWPSEGSVCQGIIPMIAEAGVQWIGTDEEILSCSTDGWVSRDGGGHLRNPEMLYRPWRVEEQGQSLQIVFRDHAMSDQIGFHYQRYAPEQAVDDFIGKLEAIGEATGGNAGHRPTLVSVILDGENCWEYYPNAGVDFLRGVYRRVVQHPKIKPVRIGDYLDQYPATDKLGHLFPGSWVQHNFGIWIGHPECNRAWDSLHETRQHLAAATAQKSKPAEQIARAWEELYIAEGSDWFWWFGDSHQSAQDGLFDRLFRKHLQNVYLALGEQPPTELTRPISQGAGRAQIYSEPTGLLRVKVDGHRSFFEWINAGHYKCGGSRRTMSMGCEGRVSDLYFGFDPERLLLRLDARGGPVREQFADLDALRLVFTQPEGFELLLSHPGRKEPEAQLWRDGSSAPGAKPSAAADQLLEIAVPFQSLGRKTDQPVHFYVELLKDEQPVERVPHEGAIETAIPSPDYELIMWQV